jgi:hypothetical protein
VEPYVVLACPLCGRRRLQPGEDASKDRLLEAIAAHVLDQHPGTGPDEAEVALASAVEATTVEAFDPASVEPERWTHPEADESEG